MASLRTEILRVRAACFADPQPIEPQQDREPYVVAVVALLGDEEHAKLRPVHVPRRRRVHAWASEVLVGVGGGSSIDVGESEEAAHHGQAPHPPSKQRDRDLRASSGTPRCAPVHDAAPLTPAFSDADDRNPVRAVQEARWSGTEEGPRLVCR